MRQNDLEDILGQLLEAEDAGNFPSIDELIKKHPEYASEIRSYLANRDLFHRYVAPSLGSLSRPAHVGDDHSSAESSTRERVGEYELVEQIASGGMGVIYRARHAIVGRVVALKMIRGGRVASETQRQRFLIEAQAAARLDHPNIVPLYEVGEHHAQPYFTMKLVEGPSLAEHLTTWVDKPGEAAGLVRDLARAMHYAHQRGIMHRDLKPSNILLEFMADREAYDGASSANVSRWRPLIADFGLAKLQDGDSDLTRSGDILGTPAYMAPEQAAGFGHDVATTTDIYSLGAILYALLTGQPMFHGRTPGETLRRVMEVNPESPRKRNPHVSRDLETICLKCLEKEPRRRYGSADALADDLQRWLDHRPIQARRSGVWEHSLKWARRSPAAAALVVVATAAAVVLLVGSLWYNARLEIEIANVKRERQRARTNFIKAEERELTARRHAYSAQINLAYRAWEAGQMAESLRLLQALVPKMGQPDLRSFDWQHLSHRAHRNLRKIITGGPGPIRGVHFFPNSRELVFGGADGALRFYDLQSGQLYEWNDHGTPFRDTAMSPKGDCLATLDEKGVLRVLNLPEGSERFTKGPFGIPSFFYTATSLIAFAPNGDWLALALPDQIVRMDASNGQTTGRFVHKEYVNAISMMPDGQSLALATNNRGILLLPEVAAGQTPDTLGTHNSYVLQFALAPDGSMMASSSEDGVVKLWDLKTRKEVASFDGHTGAVYSLAFGPAGHVLASGSEEGTAKVRDLANGEIRLFAHWGTVYSLDFSPDGKFLATGDAEGIVRLWDQVSNPIRDTLRGHRGVVYSLSFSPDGNTLASGGKDQTIRLWDVTLGIQRSLVAGHSGWVTGLAYSPDGSLLISGNTQPGDRAPQPDDENGLVRVWDVGSQRSIARIPAHNHATWGVAFAPNGRSFATAGYLDKTVKLWDVTTHQLLATFDGPPQRIWSVAFNQDGTRMASGSASDGEDERTVFIWDVITRRLLHRLKVRWVWSVAFSPDGKLLATGSEGGLVKLWDVETGTEAVPIQGHTTAVKCVSFSPDGKIVASASADKTIRLWDVVTGHERATLIGHNEPIFSLAFSRDGQTLASGDAGGTIRLWRSAEID